MLLDAATQIEADRKVIAERDASAEYEQNLRGDLVDRLRETAHAIETESEE